MVKVQAEECGVPFNRISFTIKDLRGEMIGAINAAVTTKKIDALKETIDTVVGVLNNLFDKIKYKPLQRIPRNGQLKQSKRLCHNFGTAFYFAKSRKLPCLQHKMGFPTLNLSFIHSKYPLGHGRLSYALRAVAGRAQPSRRRLNKRLLPYDLQQMHQALLFLLHGDYMHPSL